jgi:hypothetical protein
VVTPPTGDRERSGDRDAVAEPGEARPGEETSPGSGDRERAAKRDATAGETIVRFDVRATAVFGVVSAAAAVVPDPLAYVAVPLAVALFLVGTGAFLWAYAVAIGRSRYEPVTMGGVFFLGGDVAPAPVARTLRWALAAQVVVAVAVASARPFTALAATVLVPVLGLGLMALWGARRGRFADRSPSP